MQTDPAAALRWLSTQPEGSDRDFSVRVSFSQWRTSDRTAAMDWMAAEVSGGPAPWLQPTFALYARSLAATAPADAIPWAQRIQNEMKREFVLVLVARAWREEEEEAAEAWLLESSLSEAALAEVRADVPMGLQQRRRSLADEERPPRPLLSLRIHLRPRRPSDPAVDLPPAPSRVLWAARDSRAIQGRGRGAEGAGHLTRTR